MMGTNRISAETEDEQINKTHADCKQLIVAHFT